MTTVDQLVPVRLNIAVWLRFLLGMRDAILAVAASPNALWLGLAFTLSAGLAREYDGVYLLREPGHLALPLAASLATSAFLFLLVRLAADGRGVAIPWCAGYRTVLTFFWMTSPLAWIYAIPVERFADPATATSINLGFLAAVSLARVVLIVRALSVWLDASPLILVWIVAFFAVSVALVGSWITPTPLWDVMGGIRVAPSHQVIVNAKLMLWVFGIPAWIVLVIAALIATNVGNAKWTLAALPRDDGPRVAPDAWGLAAALLVAGLALVPVGQPEQARSWQAKHLLETGEIVAGLQYMAATPRDDFPPHWSPPPDMGYANPRPTPATVIEALNEGNVPLWLHDAYWEKLLATHFGVRDYVVEARGGNPQKLLGLVEYLTRAVPRTELEWPMTDALTDAAKDPDVDQDLRRQLRDYLQLSDDEEPAEGEPSE